LHEARPEPLLERRDAPAQARLRHAQRATGLREPAMLYDAGEQVEIIEIADGNLCS
jgi:hypothetical protein